MCRYERSLLSNIATLGFPSRSKRMITPFLWVTSQLLQLAHQNSAAKRIDLGTIRVSALILLLRDQLSPFVV